MTSRGLANPEPARAIWSRRLLLALFAALIALARLHTFSEPMDRDTGDYATVAHEMHHGKHLYTELPDQKPPGVHLTYYFAEAVFGYNRTAIYAMEVAAGVVTLLALYAAGASLFGNRIALWGAAFWTVISGDLALQANQPNTEVFMNAFLACGIALLVRGDGKARSGWLPLVAAGLCFAWASMYKQVVIVPPALVGLACWIAPPPGRRRLGAFGEMLLVGAVIVGAWAMMLVVFARSHQLDAFWRWVVTYNQGYAGRLDWNVLASLRFIFPKCMRAVYPVAGLAVLGLLLGLAGKRWRLALLLLGLGIGTQIAVALPGKYFPHYYQLWFPWLILGSGAGIAALESLIPIRAAGTYAGVAVLGLLLRAELPNYLLSVDQWSDAKFGTIFIDSNAVARRAAEILKPGETLFQFGDETEIYPVSGRRCPCSITAVSGAYEGRFSEECRVRLLKELEQCLPDLMIVAEDAEDEFEADPRFGDFFERHYSAILKDQTPPYTLMARKGSDLEQRLAHSERNQSAGLRSPHRH